MTRDEAQENPSQVDSSKPLPLGKLKLEVESENTPLDGSSGPTTSTLRMNPIRSKLRPSAAPFSRAVPGLLPGGMNGWNNIFVYPNLGLPGPYFTLREDNAVYTTQYPLEAFRLFPERKWEPSESLEIKEESSFLPYISQRLAGRFYYGLPVQPVIRHRRKLLILDINGLLADIVSPPPKNHKADVNIARRAVFKRPFCLDFLKFCFEHFDVGIWSSRTRKNVQKVVDYLLGDLKDRLLFCWDISHCTVTEFKTLENKHKPIVFKDVRRLWEKYDPDLPWEKGYYDQSNTLLLDDSPYKALLNPPNTAVFPHSYCFKHNGDTALGGGGDLRHYLERLMVARDIQQFVGQHPFGQTAIAEDNASWGFYDHVLSTVRPAVAYRSAQTR
ncbi:hypothetical protein MLD38_000226 [Melastoma candidum]|nr:hypothetical protein MLD38_000226 [Melastoma candidum]